MPLGVNLEDPPTRITCANSSVFKEQFAEVRRKFLEEMKAKDQEALTVEEAGQGARDVAMKAFTSDAQNSHAGGMDGLVDATLVKLKNRYNLSEPQVLSNIGEVQKYLDEAKRNNSISPANAANAQALLTNVTSGNYKSAQPHLAYAWEAIAHSEDLRNISDEQISPDVLQDNLRSSMIQQLALIQNNYGIEGRARTGNTAACLGGTKNAVIETLDRWHVDVEINTSFKQGVAPKLTVGLAQAELSNFFLESLAKNVNVDKRKEIVGLWDKDSSILLQPKLTADLRQISSEAFSQAETQLLAKYKTSNNKYYSEIRPAIAQNLALPTRYLLKPEVDVLYEYKRMLGEKISSYQDMHDAIASGGIEGLAPELKAWLDDKGIKSESINDETLAIALKTIKPKELTSLTDNILNREYAAFKAEFDQKPPKEQLDVLFDQEKAVFAGKGVALQAAMSKRFDDSVSIPYGPEIDALWGDPEYQTKIAAAIFDGSILTTEHLTVERASEAYAINKGALNEQLAEVKTLERSPKKAQDLKNLTDKLENQDKVMGAVYEQKFEKDLSAKNYGQLFVANSNEDLEKIRQIALRHLISTKDNLIKAVNDAADIEVVSKLIAADSDVNAKSADGVTPLLLAIEKRRNVIALALIAKEGINVNAKDKRGISPLMWTLKFGDNPSISLALIAKGANVKDKTQNGDSLLMIAASKGNTKVALALIDNGADVNAKNKSGITALMRAAVYNDRPDVAKLLIERGADINAKSDDGKSPLMWAAQNGKIAVAKLLIAKGADVNAKNRTGKSAIDLTKNPELKSMLIEAQETQAATKTPSVVRGLQKVRSSEGVRGVVNALVQNQLPSPQDETVSATPQTPRTPPRSWRGR